MSEGVKHDDGKTRLDLIDPYALDQLGKVLTFGAKKYEAHNWRGGMAWSRLIAAALRHLWAWIGGEKNDPESGLSHLAHAMCCVMFLLSYEHTKTGTDDRYRSKSDGRTNALTSTPLRFGPGDRVRHDFGNHGTVISCDTTEVMVRPDGWLRVYPWQLAQVKGIPTL